MSRLFEALRQSELQGTPREPVGLEDVSSVLSTDLLNRIEGEGLGLEQVRSVPLRIPSENGVVALTDEYGVAAEKFRLLAIRLRNLQQARNLKIILVTSSVMQEGKSLISANLAVALATREKQKVLLIEGDLRQPRLGKILGTGRSPGLSEWSEQNRPISDYLCRLGQLPLWLLPAGQAGHKPLEILHTPRLAEALKQLPAWFDTILIDSPPVVQLTDANVWEELSDGTLLIVREGKTPKKMLEKALENLDKKKLIGAVLNEATISNQNYYKYGSHEAAGKKAHPKEKEPL